MRDGLLGDGRFKGRREVVGRIVALICHVVCKTEVSDFRSTESINSKQAHS